MAEDTQWSGKILDANGRTGLIELDLPEGQGGTWTVQLYEREGEPLTYKGELRQEKSERGASLSFSYDGEEKPLKWRADLSRAEADRYARSAMLGAYALEGASKDLPLTQGVTILWQF